MTYPIPCNSNLIIAISSICSQSTNLSMETFNGKMSVHDIRALSDNKSVLSSVKQEEDYEVPCSRCPEDLFLLFLKTHFPEVPPHEFAKRHPIFYRSLLKQACILLGNNIQDPLLHVHRDKIADSGSKLYDTMVDFDSWLYQQNNE